MRYSVSCSNAKLGVVLDPLDHLAFNAPIVLFHIKIYFTSAHRAKLFKVKRQMKPRTKLTDQDICFPKQTRCRSRQHIIGEQGVPDARRYAVFTSFLTMGRRSPRTGILDYKASLLLFLSTSPILAPT